MRKMLCVPLALFIAACGGPPFEASGTAEYAGAKIYSEDEGRAACLRDQTKRTLEALEASGYSVNTTGLRIYVFASSDKIDSSDGPWGRVVPDGAGGWQIEVERFGRALAEEMLHVNELQNGFTAAQTAEHRDWKTNGKLKLADRLFFAADPSGSPDACD